MPLPENQSREAALRRPRFAALRRFANHPGVHALFSSRTFWVVFGVKLIAGTFLASSYLRELFAPFVNYYVESGFQDPWTHFAGLGKMRQFPYPPAMLGLLAAPRWLFGWALSAGVETVTPAHLFVLRLPLVVADVAVAVLLAVWFPQRLRSVIFAYWCSPLIFYTQYWHGQLDLLPTALLMISLYFLRRRNYFAFAAVLGVALATKSHLWVAVPFLSIYLYRQIGLRRTASVIGVQLAVCFAILAPYLANPAFRQMVFGSEEQLRILALRIPLGGDGPALLLAPLALALLCLRFEQYSKANWDLLMAYLGIVFCVFVLLAPPRPGYIIWSLPFIVYFYCRQGEKRFVALNIYTSAYLGFFLTGPESDLFDAWKLVAPEGAVRSPAAWLAETFGADSLDTARNLFFATMFAALTAILLPMYLIGVRSNRVYRMRARPVLIGIAGDSGTGKDTTYEMLRDVLGKERCLLISGDDYHRWPRGHDMWQVHTHLDMRANDLHSQQDHAVAIAQGQGVMKGTYDHKTGRFAREEWVDPETYVIFAGLHTLALESQRRLFALTMFLDPEESLRRHWKVVRDHRDRGYAPEEVLAKIEERAEDRAKFILPQAELADLVIRFRPAAPFEFAALAAEPPLTLEIVASNSFSLGLLADALRGRGALTVEHEGFLNIRQQRLAASGSIDPARIRAIAETLVPNLEELAGVPIFAADLNGVLQLVFLICLSDKLRWSDTAMPEATR